MNCEKENIHGFIKKVQKNELQDGRKNHKMGEKITMGEGLY
jgi:hypothetical protein